MIPALKINPYTYEVYDIWIPPTPAAMKLSVLGHLAASRLSIGAVMMSGDILLIDPDKPRRAPHFLFLGAGAPIPGPGVVIGPASRQIVAPVSMCAEDVSDRTIFMDWSDAHEWFWMWANEIDAGSVNNFLSFNCDGTPIAPDGRASA